MLPVAMVALVLLILTINYSPAGPSLALKPSMLESCDGGPGCGSQDYFFGNAEAELPTATELEDRKGFVALSQKTSALISEEVLLPQANPNPTPNP